MGNISVLEMFFGDPVSVIINGVIIVAFGLIVWRIIDLKNHMVSNMSKLNPVMNSKKVTRQMDREGTMKVVTGTSISAGDINSLQKDFDHIRVKHNTVSQLIPIFPSLGILGTVAGLMYQTQAEGLEQMTASIALALSSTLLALLFTVALKTYMALSVSKDLSEIEVIYRDYDRYRQDLVDKVKLSEE